MNSNDVQSLGADDNETHKEHEHVSTRPRRDVESVYSNAEFVAKLRRLADTIEGGKRFEIQIAGERIHVPASAAFSVEHERSEHDEEIEFQIKWSLKHGADGGR